MGAIRYWTQWCIGATALVAAAGGAHAAAPRAPFLALGADMDAPRGFVDMCRTERTFCAAEVASPGAAMETGALAATVTAPPAAATADAGLPSPMTVPEAASIERLLAGQSSQPAVLWFAHYVPKPAAIDLSASAPLALAQPQPATAASPAAEPTAFAARPTDASDTAQRTLLRRINLYVNLHVRQASDEQIYGQDEVWRRSGAGAGAMGDCEDIAIEKRFELIAAGFPADKLAFGVVYAHGIGLHTILIARLDEGDVVLDSRSLSIRPWYAVPYRWLSVQAMGGKEWHRTEA